MYSFDHLKVGDVVQVTSSLYLAGECTVGSVGTVVAIKEDWAEVQFDADAEWADDTYMCRPCELEVYPSKLVGK